MQTQVRQFQAALAQTELDLEHTQIRAPVDGTVIARYMDVGQTVAASFQAPTIFEIAEDLTKMQVDTNVDEADIGDVQLGQPASFTVDAFPGEIFKADVSQIRKAPINVQNVITYDVVLRVDNEDLKLLPGMTANVKILTNTLNDTLKVPNAALRFKPRGSDSSAASKSSGTQTIYMLAPDDVLQPVQVSAGLSDGNLTAISGGGVREGDRVIVGYAQASSTENGTRFPRGPSF
jgi:HlyD family secretion protein